MIPGPIRRLPKFVGHIRGCSSSLAAVVVLMATSLSVCRGEPFGERLRAVPYTDVTITGEFWATRQLTNRRKTIPHLIQMCEREGRVRNLLRVAGELDGDFEGTRTHDADLFKVIEATVCTLASTPDPALDAKLDELIRVIAAAQRDDGYLHTYAQLRSRPGGRPTRLNLFAAGHLVAAAVTYYQVTGKKTLLDVAVRLSDLIAAQYGPGQRVDVPSHSLLESALVDLARATGERRYEELATFFINERGHAERSGRKSYGVHNVDVVPLRQLARADGHVIGSLFVWGGMYDIGVRTGDNELLDACRRVFDDAVSRRMYVTGAMGRQSDERFNEPYALDNRTSIGEGCQSAMLMRVAHRLSLLDADARYADVIERVMYNNLAANVGLDGVSFFYHNRLSARPEDAQGRPYNGVVMETDKRLLPRNCLDRQLWFKVPCCPPNVAMTIARLGAYVYAVSEDSIYVNQYLGSAATVAPGNVSVKLTQETNYPWDGEIKITVEPNVPVWRGAIYLRIPDWCRHLESTSGLYRSRFSASTERNWSVQVDGRAETEERRGYVAVCREWKPRDIIELHLPMPVMQVVSHPDVRGNRGRAAIQRGPIVYCLEATDHAGSVRDIHLPDKADLRAEWRPDLLGGIQVIQGQGRRRSGSQGASPDLIAVPYAVWANRDVGEMDVWLRETGTRVLQEDPTNR
ncbi:MAG: glycoside hydrolase family 127 protein [Planctomycetes bacterium]|nr:glycoside hydrolase family 127 protein [Planctomycetota bacterium]MBL7043671.1 glycoside hydrolase family 127 protein [Pirellulaceae bacterium]